MNRAPDFTQGRMPGAAPRAPRKVVTPVTYDDIEGCCECGTKTSPFTGWQGEKFCLAHEPEEAKAHVLELQRQMREAGYGHLPFAR